MRRARFAQVSLCLSCLLFALIPTAQAAVGDYLFTLQGSPLSAPHGVAVDPYTHNILVADTGGDRVVVYNQNGSEILSIPMPPPAPIPGEGPRGVGANSLGEIFVADTPNNRILVFNYSGQLLRSFGSSGSEDGHFQMPVRIAFGLGGSLFVSDQLNSRIQAFDGAGNFQRSILVNGMATGLAFDTEHNLYVSTMTDLQVFDYWGIPLRTLVPPMPYYFGCGLAVDANNYLYTNDEGNNRIVQIDTLGNLVGTWGSFGTGNGQFYAPNGIAVDDGLNVIYVVDGNNNRVQAFRGSGAGGDNPAADYLFSIQNGLTQPHGVAVHPVTHDVYVTNGGNSVTVYDQNGAPRYTIPMPADLPGVPITLLTGLAVHADGTFFVGDFYNMRILKFDSMGMFQGSWFLEGVDTASFKVVARIALYNDELYVADMAGSRIQVFDLNGALQRMWNTPVQTMGLAVDSQGYVYAGGGGRIFKFTAGGSLLGDFMLPPGIDNTGGLAVDSGGYLYINDSTYLSDRVHRIDPQGQIVSTWGSTGSGTGQFQFPEGIAVDDTLGRIYIADRNNNRVQVFSLSGGGGNPPPICTPSVDAGDFRIYEKLTSWETKIPLSATVTSCTPDPYTCNWTVDTPDGPYSAFGCDTQMYLDVGTWNVQLSVSANAMPIGQDTVTIEVREISAESYPATYAVPEGGAYDSPVSVSLGCYSGPWSPCRGDSYYCMGENCSPYLPFPGSIGIGYSTTLRFYSNSMNGKAGPIYSASYVISNPVQGSLAINGGMDATSSTAVDLSLWCSNPDGCSSMWLSNDGVTWSNEEPYAPAKQWSLLPGSGTKTVFVRYKTVNGYLSQAFSDSIELNVSGYEYKSIVTTQVSSPSLAVDRDNFPHVMYVQNGDLWHAYQDEAGWHTELADDSASSGSSAVAVDAQGQVHVVHSTSYHVRYAVKDASGWRSEYLQYGIYSGMEPRKVFLGTDENGGVHIGIHLFSFDRSGFVYIYKDPAGGETSYYIDQLHWPGMSVEPSGIPHIMGTKDGSLHHVWHDGSWKAENLVTDSVSTGVVLYEPSLAADPVGNLHVLYKHYQGNPTGFYYYAFQGPAGWNTSTLGWLDYTVYAIAGDRAGRPHIAYSGWENPQQVAYAFYNGTSWESEQIDVGYSNPVAIAVDARNAAHLLYTRTSGELEYVRKLVTDSVPPSVVSVEPASGSVDVPVGATMTVHFSEPVDPLTVNGSTFNVGGISGTVSYDAATVTAVFTPAAPMAVNTSYTATVSGVRDFAGNTMVGEYTWSFSTVVPQDCVMSEWSAWGECSATCGGGTQTSTRYVVTPASNGGAECPTDLVRSQDCSTQPCPVAVPDVAGLTQAAAEAAISGAGLAVGAVTLQGSTTVPAGSVISQDPAAGGSVLPGSLVNLVVSVYPPEVIATDPVDGSSSVPLDKQISATFSEAMDPATITTESLNLSRFVGAKAISAGGFHSLALRNDGMVIAWGGNDAGQCTVPPGLSMVVAVAAGYRHSVALRSDGTVVAWGLYHDGWTTIMPGLSGVTAVAAGSSHTVALKDDGTVVAWGGNYFGQTTVPPGLSGIKAVAAGFDHTVALKEDGTVVAWGRNEYGQTSVPAGLTGVMAIAAGYFHTVALKGDGTVVAWGESDYGQTSVPEGLSGVTAISAGQYNTTAVKQDGTVVAWGYFAHGWPPASLSGVVTTASGQLHYLALKDDGTVVGWGYNEHGQSTIPASTTGIGVAGSIAYDAATRTATFTPTSQLEPGVTYYATVNTGARSATGIPLAADVRWSFSTAVPQDCVMSDWSDWSSCSASCGGGTQTGSRYIVTPAANGGAACPADLVRSQSCNTDPCDIPLAVVAPAALVFAGQIVDTTSPAQAVVLSNSGTAPLLISSIGITGANATSFSQTNTCGPSLAAGANCPIIVTCMPTVVGSLTASLTVASSDPVNPSLAVAMSGTGIPATIPAAPSNLVATASALSANHPTVSLTWVDNSINEAGFTIQRATNARFTQKLALFMVGANVTSFTDTTVARNTIYYYRVFAYNAAGNSPYSNRASATTPGQLPAAPSNLVFVSSTRTTISLNWTDNATNEQGFRLQKSSVGPTGPWNLAALLPANTTTYTNTGLTRNRTYWYRVRAYNASGNSPFSNVIAAGTQARIALQQAGKHRPFAWPPYAGLMR